MTFHMTERKRTRESGIVIGSMQTGPLNAITDVPGVLVGHSTLHEPDKGFATGVTAILPHPENMFRRKVRAMCHVINGRGKAVGLVELAEFGVIETPIILTSTLQVGMAADALVRYMLDCTPELCETVGTVNPMVLECADIYLNDSRSMPLNGGHVLAAINSATGGPIAQGGVGAGTGMRCLGFKSGIGTASRVVRKGPVEYMLGVLVLTNFGHTKHDRLMIKGVEIPPADEQELPVTAGSVVVLVATDAPFDARQLGRIARRAQAGIARVGSLFSSGSGDFAVAFTVSDDSPLPETLLNPFFGACIEATEEAILDSLFCATTTHGRKGRVSHAIDTDEVLRLLEGRTADG
jgi:D-aminopeptidase